MSHLSRGLPQTFLCRSCLAIVSPFRSHVADLAILDAVFKCAVDPCLLGLFQMAFAVTILHELLETQSALPAPQVILQARAIMQDSDPYNDTA